MKLYLALIVLSLFSFSSFYFYGESEMTMRAPASSPQKKVSSCTRRKIDLLKSKVKKKAYWLADAFIQKAISLPGNQITTKEELLVLLRSGEKRVRLLGERKVKEIVEALFNKDSNQYIGSKAFLMNDLRWGLSLKDENIQNVFLRELNAVNINGNKTFIELRKKILEEGKFSKYTRILQNQILKSPLESFLFLYNNSRGLYRLYLTDYDTFIKHAKSIPVLYVKNNKLRVTSYAALFAIGINSAVHQKDMIKETGFARNLKEDEFVLFVSMGEFGETKRVKTLKKLLNQRFPHHKHKLHISVNNYNELDRRINGLYMKHGRQFARILVQHHGKEGELWEGDTVLVIDDKNATGIRLNRNKETPESEEMELSDIPVSDGPMREALSHNMKFMLTSCRVFSDEKMNESVNRFFALRYNKNGGEVIGSKIFVLNSSKIAYAILSPVSFFVRPNQMNYTIDNQIYWEINQKIEAE